jgi:hypothetical protein
MKDYQELEQYALELGYTINKTKEEQSGWSFKITVNSNVFIVWGTPLKWIVANRTNNYYHDHEYFKFDNYEYSDCDINEFSNYNALKAALDYGAGVRS